MTRTGLHISKLLKVVVDDDDDDDGDDDNDDDDDDDDDWWCKNAELQIFFFCRNFSQTLFCSLKEIFSLEQYVEGFQNFPPKKEMSCLLACEQALPGEPYVIAWLKISQSASIPFWDSDITISETYVWALLLCSVLESLVAG